jgi:hypothetical protein
MNIKISSIIVILLMDKNIILQNTFNFNDIYYITMNNLPSDMEFENIPIKTNSEYFDFDYIGKYKVSPDSKYFNFYYRILISDKNLAKLKSLYDKDDCVPKIAKAIIYLIKHNYPISTYFCIVSEPYKLPIDIKEIFPITKYTEECIKHLIEELKSLVVL